MNTPYRQEMPPTMWNDSLTRRKFLRSTGKVSLGVFIGAGTALEVLASQSAFVELVVTDWFSFTITVSWPTNPGNDPAFDPYYEALSNEINSNPDLTGPFTPTGGPTFNVASAHTELKKVYPAVNPPYGYVKDPPDTYERTPLDIIYNSGTQTATLRFTHKVHYKWKVVNLSQQI